MNNNYFDMTGKVVLITGASRGLGFAMAKTFAEMGGNIAVTSRSSKNCEPIVAEINAMGRRAMAFSCHIGRWDELELLVESVYKEFGQIDVLINNAGISPVAETSEQATEELLDKILAVNFKGPFRLMALVASRMRASGGGSIINITSTGAVRPLPQFAPYAGAKGGLNIMTRALALEYGPSVRINAIMAGPFWTDMSKSWREEVDANSDSAVQRIGRPEEIVTSALYLASEYSSYTTGSVIEVSGGIR